MGDTSFNGHDLYPNRVSATSTPENCQDLCIKDEECSFWDWVDPLAKVVRVDSRGKCFLKKSQAVGGFKRAIGIVSALPSMANCHDYCFFISKLGDWTQVLSGLLQDRTWLH